MNADEEYVRARWNVYAWKSEEGEYFVDLLHSGSEKHGAYTFPAATEAEAWSATRAFTEQREREIAEVQEEIAILNEGVELAASTDADERKYGIPFKRILVVEQARLAELRRGMKEGSE